MSRKRSSEQRAKQFVPPAEKSRFVNRATLATKQYRAFRNEIRELYHVTDGLASFNQESIYQIPIELTPARAYVGRLRVPPSKPRPAQENQPENGNNGNDVSKIRKDAVEEVVVFPPVAEPELEQEFDADTQEQIQADDQFEVIAPPNRSGHVTFSLQTTEDNILE
jgi:hypothetical protein